MSNCKITVERLQEILQRLDKMADHAEKRLGESSEEIFFDNSEFIMVMNICKRTAQEWRVDGIIGYSQIGKKFYYKLSDIFALLEKNYKPSKS